ncbi:MAG: hypothetical protein HC819_00620 [Cyclobacteriaceae bacterium]|nr:hypothetical protein [Cyclobacteriaceae bacterium]
MKFYLILFFSIFTLTVAMAQQKDTNKGKAPNEAKPGFDRGATYSAESQKTKSKQKKSRQTLNGEFDQKVEEYKQRMEANAKKNARMEKELQKPRYSDPTYFGHKKKPKKRPAGKKKFCKECGMSH